MFKLVLLMRKRSDLTDAAFRDYYENHHSLLGARILGKRARRYFRRYLAPADGSGEGNVAHFDVMTEIWFDSKAAFEETMHEIGTTNAAALIAEDEAKFLDPTRATFFVVEEGESELPAAS